MEDLVEKVKGGKYKVPSTISRELIEFLNNMLQYDSAYRPTAKDLQNFAFLTHNVKDFHHMNAEKTTKNNNNNIQKNKNKSIWAIYNDEDKFININEKKYSTSEKQVIKKNEVKKIEQNNNQHQHQHHHNNNAEQNVKKEYRKAKTFGVQNQYSFYGQAMKPNAPTPTPQMVNYPQQIIYPYNNLQQYAYPRPYFGVPTMPYPNVGYNAPNQYPKVPNPGFPYIY